MNGLRSAAADVLEGNWNGAATLPARDQYPHQWSWDSAFISVGWARLEPPRAQQELISLFRGQWSSGRVPHIVFNADAGLDSYFPGPDYWRTGSVAGTPPAATSGIVQPPVHARAALTAYSADPGSERSQQFLAAIYPQLRSWHRYLHVHRTLNGTGVASIVHPWESGLDNSPAWDGMLDGKEQSQPFIRRDVAHVNTEHRPTDADYRAYVALAGEYRDAGYSDTTLHDHRFVVQDPLFNAVFLDAELCCAAIAETLGEDAAPHLVSARQLHEAMMLDLWDGSAGRFRARDVKTGNRSTVDTVGSLMPLLDPWLSPDVRNALVELAWSEDFAGGCAYPMPSTALTSAAFERKRYWRGPTWINTNWLLWIAATEARLTSLATCIAESCLALVTLSGFREYFDPLTGNGLGADRFSWTAALSLDFLSADGGAPIPRRANPAGAASPNIAQ